MDGPSEYAFEKDDPANGRDPLGLLRDEQEPDPNDKDAKKIQERYNKAYGEFKKTPSGAQAAKRLKEDPNIKLTVLYDPKYNKPGEALVIENYKIDPTTGLAVSATLRVGPNFDKKIDDPNYPYGSKLEERSKPRQVYAVAHEEQGHFMNAATDPDYAKRVQRKDEIAAEFNAALTKADEKFPGPKNAAERLNEMRRLVPQIKEKTQEGQRIHTANENQADATARPFVEEYEHPKKHENQQ